MPEGIYFTSVKQDGQILNVTGIAQTQERVSELLRNTAYNSEWLVKPELIESKATTRAAATTRDQKRLFDFSMRLTVKRPQDTPRPSQAAGAARRSGGGERAGAGRRRGQEDLTRHGDQSKTANVDLNSVFEGAASQFRGLNPNEPGQWPLLPKTLTFVAVAAADGRRRLVRRALVGRTTSSTPSATRSRR